MRDVFAQASEKVAVILNANARRVTPRVMDRLERQRCGADIFYSRSIEEADEIAGKVLSGGYSTVLTGGGDGTIVQFINSMFQKTNRVSSEGQFKRDHRWLQPVPAAKPPLPSVGILKLGTGNALASLVGAGRYDQDMARICRMSQEGQSPQQVQLPLLECEGQVTPFAGLGWDAMILNDYNRLKQNTRSSLFRRVTHSVLGYLIASIGITAPQMALQRSPEVELRTLGEASLIGPDGDPVQQYPRGTVLYRGPVNMVAFSTVPNYGYDFMMFPFAHGLTRKFQVRLSSMGVPEVLSHLPSIWKGRYRSNHLVDFHCERVTLRFSRPVSYQLGGDAKGERESITVGLAECPLDLIDYRTTLQLAARKVAPSASFDSVSRSAVIS